MKIIFATANAGKLREAAGILGEGFELLSPAELGVDADVEENGATLEENSLIKARHLYALTGYDCFADDTGLEVDALGGAPGVHTARYAGEAHDSSANMAKLLAELDALGPDAPRTARFRTVVTLIIGGEPHRFEGRLEGSIARRRSGAGGFGYDPVFIPEGGPETLAEISAEAKNAISHRGKALRAMAAFLSRYTPGRPDAASCQDKSQD